MKPPARKMGRPLSGEPRKVQVFSFLPPDEASWFMGLPPKERSAWLAAHIAADRAAQHATGTPPSPDCAADRAPSAPDAPRKAS